MQATADEICRRARPARASRTGSAPVGEVFRLQGAEELERGRDGATCRSSAARARAVVLAASRGSELGELTADRPKAMVHVRGKPTC